MLRQNLRDCLIEVKRLLNVDWRVGLRIVAKILIWKGVLSLKRVREVLLNNLRLVVLAG